MSAWPLQPRYRLEEVVEVQRQGTASSRRATIAGTSTPVSGKRTANKYGPLIGASDFFVAKR